MEKLVNLNDVLSYYAGKKVFITGHTGFKGAWLAAALREANATIKGYSLAPEYEDGVYDVLAAQGFGQHVVADIRDKQRLHDEITSFQPDFVFHLAAQPLVRRSYRIPAETFEVNVAGTANLLEAVKSLDGRCTVVVITTDKVYQNREQQILYKEDDVLGGFDPYSASKACAEIVVSSFRSSFFSPDNFDSHGKSVASVRAGNVIGGGDWSEDRIVPDIIRSLQNGIPVHVRNPHAVRPWQHVLEPVGAYLLIGTRLDQEPQKFSKPYNIGPLPHDHLKVKDLVELCIQHWGNGSWEDVSQKGQPHEATLLRLSIGRIQQELGWQPRLNASAAIKWSVDWYKTNPKERAEITFRQIKQYFSL